MKISELKEPQNIANDKKLSRIYFQFVALLNELNNKGIPSGLIKFINNHVEELNTSSLNGPGLIKAIKQKQTTILKQLEKELKMVPKYYYRNLWMLFGMSGIGLPIGVAFGLSVGNMGLLGIGLPIGMSIGFAIGMGMDKKALSEGRQLNLEIKY